LIALSKKTIAESGDTRELITWLDRSARYQAPRINMFIQMNKKEVNPTSGKTKQISQSTVKLKIERNANNFLFKASGSLDYQELEFTGSKGKIGFEYDSFSQKLKILKNETDFGSTVANLFGKGYLSAKNWTLDLSYEKFFDEKSGEPKNTDIAGPLLRRQLFIGRIPVPNTINWKLPLVIQELLMTVKGPYDKSSVDLNSQSSPQLYVKNGSETLVSFRNRHSILSIESLNQKRPLKKDHKADEITDFQKTPFEETSLTAETVPSLLP
jgi:hypothetical protein